MFPDELPEKVTIQIPGRTKEILITGETKETLIRIKFSGSNQKIDQIEEIL